jgi:hypothetical protein
MRRPPQLGQNLRPLHEKGSKRSSPQPSLQTGTAVRQIATGEELSKLVLHEAGQAGAVRPLRHRAEEGPEARAHDGMEHPLLGSARARAAADPSHPAAIAP